MSLLANLFHGMKEHIKASINRWTLRIILHAKRLLQSIKHLYYFYINVMKLPKSKPIYNHTVSALGNIFVSKEELDSCKSRFESDKRTLK
jgi:hypothetical protein